MRAGSVEHGCTTAREAVSIIRQLDSPRVRQHLTGFWRAAQPYAGTAAVREFHTRYGDLLGPTTRS